MIKQIMSLWLSKRRILFAINIVDVSKNLASFFTVRNFFCFTQSMMKTTVLIIIKRVTMQSQWIEHDYKAYAKLSDPISNKI